MGDLSSEIPYRIVVFILIVAAALLRIFFLYRDRKARTRDAKLLAIGLRVELTALRQRYVDNMDALQAGAPFLFSTRWGNGYYRGNLGRLAPLLGPEVLEAVVAVFTYNELMEADLSMAALRAKGPYCYRVDPARPRLLRLEQTYRLGCDRVDLALRNLNAMTTSSERRAALFVLWQRLVGFAASPWQKQRTDTARPAPRAADL